MKLGSLRDVYIDQIRDLHSAEKQLLEALPRMAKAASSENLRTAIEHHVEETRSHLARLEKISTGMHIGFRRKKCRAMEGLIQEEKELLDMDADPEALDAGIIAAAQRMEHYEIAGYGCARTYATLLGEEEAAGLLEETLDEEKAEDAKLTELAMSGINVEAGLVGAAAS